jgi:hypothetical protein
LWRAGGGFPADAQPEKLIFQSEASEKRSFLHMRRMRELREYAFQASSCSVNFFCGNGSFSNKGTPN